MIDEQECLGRNRSHCPCCIYFAHSWCPYRQVICDLRLCQLQGCIIKHGFPDGPDSTHGADKSRNRNGIDAGVPRTDSSAAVGATDRMASDEFHGTRSSSTTAQEVRQRQQSATACPDDSSAFCCAKIGCYDPALRDAPLRHPSFVTACLGLFDPGNTGVQSVGAAKYRPASCPPTPSAATNSTTVGADHCSEGIR
eukprot:Lankesteria_metandrocarpae@DN9434_c0_g1_i1.p1